MIERPLTEMHITVQGAKGATLRGFETKYHTFMFFDTENIREGKRRLYILGPSDGRKAALRECESAVAYKMSGNGSLRSWSCPPCFPSHDYMCSYSTPIRLSQEADELSGEICLQAGTQHGRPALHRELHAS